MRARIVQTGGLTGIRREWRLEDGDLSAEAEETLRGVLDRSGFFAEPPAASGPGEEAGRARDTVTYEIAVEDAGRARTLRCPEPALTPPLRACLEALLAAARPVHPTASGGSAPPRSR